MRPSALLGLCLSIALAALPVGAVDQAGGDELEQNRRQLELWRGDIEHYSRLQRDLKAFYDLSDEQRDRLRRFDHDLHATDAKTQKHLWTVLDRYVGWFNRLTDADRQRILNAERADRLKIVREIRDQQYIDWLPATARAEMARLPEAQQHAQVVRLRNEDRQLRDQCRTLVLTPPAQLGKPTKLEEFPNEVRPYLRQVLWPALTQAERQTIETEEGAPWPQLARTLLDLSQKHVVTLPGPANGPKHYRELPEAYKTALPIKDLKGDGWKRMQELDGKWPEFAIAFTNAVRQRKLTVSRQLGPCRATEFPAPVANFIEKQLMQKLAAKEADDLKLAEGRWPDYPRTLLELSRKHGLEVPLMRLPGPKELWDRARTGG